MCQQQNVNTARVKHIYLSLSWASIRAARCRVGCSAFFVTVRAGTAYRKIWRLVNNFFFARIIRFTVQKFQLFWVIFCIIIFFHWIMAHFNFVISQNAKWGHAGFYIDCYRMTSLLTCAWLISKNTYCTEASNQKSKYAYRKIFFYKKALVGCILKHWWHGEMTRNNSLVPSLIISGPPGVAAMSLLFIVVTIILMYVNYCNCWITMKK